MTTSMAPPTRTLSPAPGDTGTIGTEGLVTLPEGTAGAYPVGATYLLTVAFQAGLVQTDGLGRRAVGVVCGLPGQLVTAGPHEVTVIMEVE